MSHYLKKSASTFIIRIIGTVIAFLFNVMLARLLGAEGTGIYVLSGTIISISTIVSRLGLDNTILRFVSPEFESSNWAKIKAIHNKVIFITLSLSSLVTITIFISAEFVAHIIFKDINLEIPLKLMSLSIIPLSLLNLYSEFIKAYKKPETATIIQGFSIPCLGLILLYILASKYGLIGAALASFLTSLIIMLISIIIWNKLSNLNDNTKTETSVSTAQLLNSCLPLLMVAILNVVIDFSDTVMIASLIGSAQVGLYSVALNITRISSILLSSINSVVAPQFSSLWARGEKEDLNILAKSITKKMGIAALFFLLIIIIIPDQILALFGAEFLFAKNTMFILALGQFIALATGPVAYLLMMTGNEKFHRNNVFLCAILNIGLNFMLIPKFGIEGAAIATTVALTIKNILAVYFVRTKLGIKVLI
jgi:O-antigen/teichoic acid export membrane protein